ncbi:MAG: PHP domain-containing protein [Clostridia bacterium]|nr:PHP domain-containing protein [Clostridia bacterium]
MRFIADHDLHIHSCLSLCAPDPAQSPEAILKYGEDNGFKTLCLTDHMWDAAVPGACEWYAKQPYERSKSVLPLPQSDKVRFLFGCETEMDKNFTIGLSPETAKELDFIIVPTTHMHRDGFTVEGNEGAEERAKLWVKRFEAVLDSSLPFEKTGLAHMTCCLIWHKGNYLEVLKRIPLSEYHRLFERAAKAGLGIELNFPAYGMSAATAEIELVPYRIAKEEGCKFYLGGDAHVPAALASRKLCFEAMIDVLGLTEDDKIPFLHG